MIFLSPHNDDETLFGSFLIQAYRPLVIVCLRSDKQTHATAQEREAETAAACSFLGVEYLQLPIPDTNPNWQLLRARLEELDRDLNPEQVIAPAPMWELNGHTIKRTDPAFGCLHHDFVGEIALQVFGDRVLGYTTYTRYHGRTLGVPVVPHPSWIQAKLRALACYRTQIVDAGCRPHFMGGLDEYVAA